MRFTYKVTDENCIQIFDNGSLVFQRGPYANKEEPEDFGVICVGQLERGEITIDYITGNGQEE
jgi:hypothetical protein